MVYKIKNVGIQLQQKNRYELLSSLPQGGVIVEVGVWRGAFSRKILEVCKPKKLYLIDPWMWHAQWHCNSQKNKDTGIENPDEIYQSVVSAFMGDSRVTIMRCGSLDSVRGFEDESIDAVYIDGDHRYDAIRQDVHAWFPKVKMDGFLCGDDKSTIALPPELTEAEKNVNGVPRAVIEFLGDLHDTEYFGLCIHMFRLYGNNWMIQKTQL